MSIHLFFVTLFSFTLILLLLSFRWRKHNFSRLFQYEVSKFILIWTIYYVFFSLFAMRKYISDPNTEETLFFCMFFFFRKMPNIFFVCGVFTFFSLTKCRWRVTIFNLICTINPLSDDTINIFFSVRVDHLLLIQWIRQQDWTHSRHKH